jgi:F0F1-type ATP synthase membrane subunit c/vacuolar-type H+-ATPase subunit K
MEAEAAKYIGAGVALLCLFGVALGLGNIFSNYITATARNPSAEPKFKALTLVGAGMVEALGIFALVVALMLIV